MGVKERQKGGWIVKTPLFFFNLQIFHPIPGCLLIPSNKKVYIWKISENMNLYTRSSLILWCSI